MHIETIIIKAFRTLLHVCSLFKSECSSTSIKVTLPKVLIRSTLTYACPAWDNAAGIYVMKLQPVPLVAFQGGHRPANCMWFSKFRIRGCIQKFPD